MDVVVAVVVGYGEVTRVLGDEASESMGMSALTVVRITLVVKDKREETISTIFVPITQGVLCCPIILY